MGQGLKKQTPSYLCGQTEGLMVLCFLWPIVLVILLIKYELSVTAMVSSHQIWMPIFLCMCICVGGELKGYFTSLLLCRIIISIKPFLILYMLNLLYSGVERAFPLHFISILVSFSFPIFFLLSSMQSQYSPFRCKTCKNVTRKPFTLSRGE